MQLRSAELRRARPLLGTFVEIVVPNPEGERDDIAVSAAFGVIEEVQRRMSFHDPASMLSKLNREAFERAVVADEWTLEVLRTAEELHAASGGVFDVAIAPRLQALGFLPGEAGVANGSFADVEIDGDRVRYRRPGIRLDLGGIAKGFAVDRAVAVLQETGVSGGLVNAGGDLRAFGGRAFPVSIRHPNNPGITLGPLELRNAAIATSAHYFAERAQPDACEGPIVDPRKPATISSLPASVTVRAETAMLADALTKVVMLDAEIAPTVLVRYGASALLISTSGEAVCSENWDAALHVPA